MALIASGRERPFTAEELLVAATDHDGRTRMANHVFVRVSGYELGELIGGGPDVLRHPGMPRAVGRVGGEGVRAGRGVPAYVRQLAKDGAQYWLLALHVPIAGGVLTLAVKPAAETLATARDAYADVRDVEVVVEDRDPRRRELGIAAGVERLSERLGDVEAFMRAAFVEEVRARRPGVGAPGAVADAASALLAGLDRANDRLAGHDTLSESLLRKSGFLAEL